MAQPGGYQYPTYVNPNIPFNKGGAPPLVNGQPVVTLGAQNGIPSPQFHTAGTPSSQSSKDPSREASRDPSPTHNLHNQYRPQLQRPPMPPINGQQMTNPSPVPPPTRPPPMNYQQNPYNQSDENSRMAHVPSQNYKPTENINKTAELFPWSQSEFTTSTPTLTPSQINPSTGPPQIFPSEQKQVLQQPTVSSPNFNQTRNDNATATTMIPRSEPQGLNHLPTSNVQIANTGSSNTQNVFPLRTQPMQPMQNAPQTQNLVQQTQQQQQQPNLMTPQVPPFVNHANTPGFGTNSPLLPPPPTVQNQNTQQQQQQQNLLTNQRRYPAANPYGAPPPNTAMSPIASNQGVIGQQQKYSQPPGPPPLTGQPPNMPPMPGPQSQNPYNVRPQYPGQMSNVPLDNMQNRYPPAYGTDPMNELNNQMAGMKVTQAGFNKLWGMESVDLLQCRNVLPPEKVEPPKIHLHQEFLDSVNCSPDIFRCTLTKIPESNSLLQKSRLPLGVLIHPFKDLNHLPVIQCSTIVRCRACRTYINPFVYFADSKRWKCNLCFRINELPDEFQFDPVTKSYGDPSRRPEVKTSTIEFIAPSEYMLRPPQPAVYLFILDVSRLAVDSGYLAIVCNTISDELSRLPGDGRTQVGFLAVDSAIHFFCIPDNVSQPHEMIMLDVDDVFLPCPDNLIVNLKEREELVRDLLAQLPTKFQGTHDTSSALGAGLQAAYKLMSPTGGRITVFQTCLPNLGPGALTAREDPSTRASKDVPHLNPATDFYKRLALDCSGQQIAVDLFLLNSQYSDLATLSGMCKFSGGCIHHMPLFRADKPQCAEPLERMLRRYLTRKIGFEAVLRIRCTRGLSIHTFHGNFFVRSTDLLSLPNVNPDAGFGMQIAIEESLSDVQSVCFQAALLYTSSKGERRIRVHTLCLPVTANLSDVLHSADQQCITGLVCKMAVDRSLQSSLSDARDALINVVIDVLSSYKLSQSIGTGGLSAPGNLKLLPLYVIALLKCIAFRSGLNTRLDDRVFAMCQLKTLPLYQLMQYVYPDLYPVHALDDRHSKDLDGKICPQPPRLHLSAEKLDSRGAFLMDAADKIYIYVGKNVHPNFCSNVLGVSAFSSIPEEMYDLPELDTVESERLRNFVFSLQDEKPYYAAVQIIRDDSHFRTLFTERLIEDRLESALSYYEFLQHLKTQVK